jgi:hypothetical protein
MPLLQYFGWVGSLLLAALFCRAITYRNIGAGEAPSYPPPPGQGDRIWLNVTARHQCRDLNDTSTSRPGARRDPYSLSILLRCAVARALRALPFSSASRRMGPGVRPYALK